MFLTYPRVRTPAGLQPPSDVGPWAASPNRGSLTSQGEARARYLLDMPPEVFRQLESKDSYGWFELDELSTFNSTLQELPEYHPSSTPASRRNSWDKKNLEHVTVLFLFHNLSSSSSCKSFECLYTKQNSLHIQIAIPNFRIIQGEDGIRAEYRIVFTINHDSRSSWRRYTDFLRLAKLLKLSTGYFALFLDYSASPMPLSQESWLQIESNKCWFRSLSVRYLAWKCARLEEFLKHVLFENSSPEVLMDFVNPQI